MVFDFYQTLYGHYRSQTGGLPYPESEFNRFLDHFSKVMKTALHKCLDCAHVLLIMIAFGLRHS